MISPACHFHPGQRDLPRSPSGSVQKRSMEPPQMIRSCAMANKIDAAIDPTKAADVTSREGVALEISMVGRRLAKKALILSRRLQMRKIGGRIAIGEPKWSCSLSKPVRYWRRVSALGPWVKCTRNGARNSASSGRGARGACGNRARFWALRLICVGYRRFTGSDEEVDQTLQELRRTLRSMRVLTDYLEEHPGADSRQARRTTMTYQ